MKFFDQFHDQLLKICFRLHGGKTGSNRQSNEDAVSDQKPAFAI